ncbi:hypothetical protein Q4555_02665 [Octadecabacter sp. 1_MG-2023]|uniref:hypothetical protein n=1 Tax=unclassified Octadecabacter TaxID=196158 RepID=UPI001C08A520|nr:MULTISPECIES: hypothetical protein [unclassified Octadecabacter]MBU2992995.1 hypothetical protein [Octadecabacter sp. B2R22]MDO6733553.1 hypothetical protein [Octadecabacter sp. 1_MG-2023]
MELPNTTAQLATAPTAPQTAPAPAEQDGRVSADAAAITKDPTPEVALPIPANQSQTGLVSKAVISDKEVAPKLDTSGVSAAERVLKPYGITMLPERQDAPEQSLPNER